MIIEEQIEENLIFKVINRIKVKYQRKIDRYILYKKSRWFFNLLLILLYANRIYNIGGFYIVTYIYCVYQLQLIIEYFTPLGLPPVNFEDDENEDDQFQNDFVELPTTISNKNELNDKEFRPLLRTTSEFKAWQKSVFSVIMSYLCTYIPLWNIPVYWPFLFGYFFVIVGMSIRKYIKHMKKYGYTILDFTKKK
ncbi:unnamed protein product [Paramecium pentaurelia]|uniref:Protein RER1 n=1 Tax=Paramecium pentaurelia TaxID=43138 RepID=A0A8S1UP14_9CILI|nr:unnamed protein product [Paramecium pentaurelia]